MRVIISCWVAALFTMTLVAESWAQDKFVPGRGTPMDQAIEVFASEWFADGNKAPSFTPSSKQLDAPSSTNISTNILDKASFTELLSLALDNGLTGGDGDKAVTLSLNLFGLLATKDPNILDDQERYAMYKNMRRVSGIITFGEAVAASDVDTTGGDLSITPKLTDVITVRARYRILGSRDRRDYWQKYLDKIKPFQAELHSDLQALIQETDIAAELGEVAGETAEDLQKQFEIWLLYLRDNPEYAARIARSRVEYLNELSKQNEEVDHNFLLTLDAAGEFRDHIIGEDRFMVQLVAEGGGVGIDFTGNVEYIFEEIKEGNNHHDVRLGVSISNKFLRASPVNQDGFDATLGVAGEIRNDDRDNLFKFNLKIQFPTASGLALPLALTWTKGSKSDEENDFQVNVGLGYDISALWQ